MTDLKDKDDSRSRVEDRGKDLEKKDKIFFFFHVIYESELGWYGDKFTTLETETLGGKRLNC